MDTLAGILQVASVVLVLVLVHRPLGDLMARMYESRHDWRVERFLYRLIGVDPRSEQTWPAYLRAVLAFSLVGVLVVYGMQRLQGFLPYALGLPAVPEGISFNTAVSFVTNTNWQSYSPEATMGYTVQLAGLAVQNFVSAAVGMAVAIALVRGFARTRSGTIGNMWVDLLRGSLRLLLPLSLVTAVVLIAGGVIQNFAGFQDVATLAGGSQTIPGGPVASQEAIKMLGTNGGGFFNANSAHPFEDPTAWTSAFQVLLMLVIPFSLPRTFGKMVGDTRQGTAIAAVMATIFLVSFTALTLFELNGAGTAPMAAGGAMEGKEQRFGIIASTLFGSTSTLTSTGAVNSMHDSYTALGGMMPMINMMLGEVAPGGVGSGLYGMLVLAVISVFVAGLLVGRTPEYLGKKIGPREIKLASLYILVTPTLVLVGTALSFAIPAVREDVEGTSILNSGLHGLSEVVYAFTSAANNNGSAFAGLTASTPWFTTALGVAMLLGRFLPIVFVLALAGSLAAQDRIPTTSGTLPTHRPQFVGLLIGVTVIVTALTYFPVLALGPLAEGLAS
ncbi:potassium-transporting ATPase subunit KdpA [Clavibacter michiganensis]|uniref:Potassium-transporting ATPase potassium-binding subunit n=1 Tax=Clavibacter michiganensis subsp. insidiosus TaxID=33014 RepID=A0A0D5CKC9_9MICO|nr:potassium-transporting ATPase subunit KdpA [Clavibacter michiganensis]AJW80116.1 potassium-transporting ATPase subunit A [Clavibacter michiganensis subsp. insidiosus]AWF97225.1 potassium-transporting ATPase subunit A [Clavibacter michiganensis subsp. insidiosus]AWG02688.1 potassium-transporting ATPase subunit A [Clavibacter michiganensis subsp. insidiosus]OQJ58888.1 potassium-transporting ATPase subunit A [Clavibacter michiganensis subsp. insidiosus]RII87589.1 potassium-transporting ATPase 